jgi:acyl-CoA reductase-like NAD-dependent aldehyde dehydrogenase
VARKESRISLPASDRPVTGGKSVRGDIGPVLSRGGKRNRIGKYAHPAGKDLPEAVAAARAAFAAWSKTSGHLRAEILNDAAEMLERRRGELEAELGRAGGDGEAGEEVDLTIERLVHYAGWADKFGQVFGRVNPGASPDFNSSWPQPSGVVAVVCPDEPPLLAVVSLVAPVILSGNTAVVIASATQPLPAVTFSEIIAMSALPRGVINLLTGDPEQLAPGLAAHPEVNGVVDASGEEKFFRAWKESGGLKRQGYVARMLRAQEWRRMGENPYWILDTLEMKAGWPSIGH